VRRGGQGGNGARLLIRGAAVALLPVLLAACSGWSNAWRTEAGGYTLLLKTDPMPAQVGRPATVLLGIRDAEERTVRACNVSFRQHMPEHEMSSDDVIVQLQEQRSGVYSGVGPEYSMGGDWRIEVSFDCGTGPVLANFDFHLDWPE
jgi:hypothetical protein